jgi:hypothetical protein
MEIEREHLERVRAAADELRATVQQEPDVRAVTAAWDALDKLARALADLCPNHTAVSSHAHSLAIRLGATR